MLLWFHTVYYFGAVVHVLMQTVDKLYAKNSARNNGSNSKKYR